MQIYHSNGQSLVEILIAIGLLAMVAGTVLVFLSVPLSNIDVQQTSFQASAIAEEGLEAVRLMRDAGWSNLAPGQHGLAFSGNTWSFQGVSDVSGGFTRTVTVTDISTNERQVASRVTWTPSTGRSRSVTFATNITNWRSITVDLLTGNWCNPRTLGSIDLGPGNEGTSLAASSSRVYITAKSASVRKDDFYIVDVTDGANPFIRGSVQTGPGLMSVVTSGTVAYTANDDAALQFQTIDISPPGNAPTVMGTLSLTGSSGRGLSVALAGNTAYVGTQQNGGPEFFVVDVTNPYVPVIQGSLEIGADVDDMAVLNSRVFLATVNDSQELVVVNATNPVSPAVSVSYDAPGSNDAHAVYGNFQDDRVYLARSSDSGASTPEVVVLDASNPDAPTLLGSLELSDGVSGVFVADNLAFLATGDTNQEYKTLDVTDPQNMTICASFNFPQSAEDLYFDNNTIYAAVRSNDALRLITSQ